MIEIIRIALRNIAKRKKRAALTMIGVFIGIAAVVALVSLGQGLQTTINEQFEKVGADKIYIQAKDPLQLGEKVPGEMTSHEVDYIENVHGVAQTAGTVFRGAKVTYNDLQRTQFLLAIPDDKDQAELAYAFTTWEIAEGRRVNHKDKNKVALGYNLVTKELFGRNIPLGSKIDIEGELFEVVGSFKRTGDPGLDASVVIALDDAKRILGLGDTFNYVVAQTVKGENPDDVAERIKKRVRRDRHLEEGQEDFAVTTSTDLIASFNQVLNIIQVVFVGIALISLLVGGIGIMNTMYTAVLERTREIGVMKAIGAKNRDVLSIFLLESGLLGTAGGLIGIIIGAGISKAVELGANAAFGPGTITAVFPVYLLVGVLIFSFIVGTISGVLPARQASLLKPVEALRYE